MLVLNLPFKALMFLTLMRPSLVLFLVLWLKLVKDFLKVRCRLALLPFLIDRKSGSAGMPRPTSYAVFCLKKKNQAVATSQEAVQNQNEPQLRDENAHNDKSVHGVLNTTYQAGLQ